MVEVRELKEDCSWDGFVVAHPRGTLFHTSGWLRILAKNQQLSLVRLGFFEGNRLVAVLPLFVKRFGILKVAGSPFVAEDTPYLGILSESEGHVAVLAALKAVLRKRGIHFLRMIEQNDSDNAGGDGVSVAIRHTHVLDLRRAEDEIWSGFEGRCRTAVRKAEKSGVVVAMADDPGFVRDYHGILENLYARQKMMTPNPLGFYQDVWAAYKDRNALFIKATVGGELAAAAIIIHSGNRAYYINGVSVQAFNGLSPNNAIQWFVIKQLKAMGVEFYDFMGSDIERLAQFKKSFGGTLTLYRNVEISGSALASFLRKHYNTVRLMAGKVKLAMKRG